MKRTLCFCLLLAIVAVRGHAAYDDGSFFTGNTCQIRVEPDGWTLINDNIERRLKVDANGLRTTSVIKKPENIQLAPVAVGEGRFLVDGIAYDLSNGWQVESSSIAPEGSAQTLTVTMRNQATGFRVTLNYTIYPGTRFWIRKRWSFALDQPRTISGIVLDAVAGPQALFANWLYVALDSATGVGNTVLGSNIGIAAFANSCPSSSQTDIVKNGATGYYAIEPIWKSSIIRQNFTGPTSYALYFSGVKATTPFAIQLTQASAITRGNPWRGPVLFNTWYATSYKITESACQALIPAAADLGCQMFVVDDGWQTNSTGVGRYGDWLNNTTQFPNGLKPVADLVRANGMEFGFWLAPGLTQGSQVRIDHPDWAIQIGAATDPSVFCQASGWNAWLTNRMTTLTAETNPAFLKLDFTVFNDGCTNPVHNHIAGNAVAEQYEAWKSLCAALRTHRPDIIIDRPQAGLANFDVIDQMWENDWNVSSQTTNPNRLVPSFWYYSADLTRYAWYDYLKVLPSYCVTGTVPAHLDGMETNTELLNYFMASVAANACNLEISNTLNGITETEKDIAKGWIDFNKKMRPWLAYTQPIKRAILSDDEMDGNWHLRRLYKGRYGYLVVFNETYEQQQFAATVDPHDYFIDMEFAHLGLAGRNPAAPFVWDPNENKLNITVTLPAYSWQVIDITHDSPPPLADTDNDGCINDNDLINMIIDFGGPPLSSQSDTNLDGMVDDIDLVELILVFGTGC